MISILNHVSKYLKCKGDIRAQYFYRVKKLYKMKTNKTEKRYKTIKLK